MDQHPDTWLSFQQNQFDLLAAWAIGDPNLPDNLAIMIHTCAKSGALMCEIALKNPIERLENFGDLRNKLIEQSNKEITEGIESGHIFIRKPKQP